MLGVSSALDGLDGGSAVPDANPSVFFPSPSVPPRAASSGPTLLGTTTRASTRTTGLW